VLAYYQDRSSPLLVTFGSRGVTAAALLPELPTEWGAVAELAPIAPVGNWNWVPWLDWHSELGAAALLKAVR